MTKVMVKLRLALNYSATTWILLLALSSQSADNSAVSTASTTNGSARSAPRSSAP